MLSYHNDPAIKAKYIARFAEHRKLDQVIQGTGFNNGRGCFVGCTLDAYRHDRFPIELGWPEWLARLCDSIFEGIPKSEAAQFGTDILEAVPIGVDLEPIKHIVAIARMKRNLQKLIVNKHPYAEEVRQAVALTIAYHESPSESAARSAAESAAESAARSARSAAESAWSVRSAAWPAWSAWSAAWSARSAAWSAAESVRSAAESAAWSVESVRSAAWSAAWSEYQAERDALLVAIRTLEPK